MQIQSALGVVLALLGFVVAVVGPTAAALAGNPLVQSHQKLVHIMAIVGVVIMAAGVAHDALQRWLASQAQQQAADHRHEKEMMVLK